LQRDLAIAFIFIPEILTVESVKHMIGITPRIK